ncbi:MAG: hypothetical protein VX007_02295 [Pseudomonadota bacterium]|nr:hypothetical protein [Pseudomonadota bacterium]
MGFVMMAPAMEDREGTFTVYGVGRKFFFGVHMSHPDNPLPYHVSARLSSACQLM